MRKLLSLLDAMLCAHRSSDRYPTQVNFSATKMMYRELRECVRPPCGGFALHSCTILCVITAI